jgi:uncharacterized protein (DUF2147 family)
MRRTLDTLLRRVPCIALLIPMLLSRTAAFGADIQGVWMIEGEVAVAIAECAGDSLCGRIVWLKAPRDAAGQPKRDQMNPDAALRKRLVCGLTVLEGLRPAGPARWEAGSFYDPRDGRRYTIAMELKSANTLVARVYLGMRILGKSQTLLRAQGATKAWC